MSKFLTVEQVENLVYEHSVHHEVLDTDSRWSNSVLDIVRDPEDNKLYRIYWQEGATESQEDEFESGDYDEVFEVSDDIIVTAQVSYYSQAELESQRHDYAKDLVSLKAVSTNPDQIIKEQAVLDKLNLEHVIEALEQVNMLNLSSQLVTSHRVALDYLNSLKQLMSQRTDEKTSTAD